MPTGWICGQTARDFVATKTGVDDEIDIQESEELKTSKFFCKTNFNMADIPAEEADYANFQLPKFYRFKSPDARERKLYDNFCQVERDVKHMINIEIFHKNEGI